MNLNFDIRSIVISIIAVILSMFIHEVGHGLVSYWFGDPTAKQSGRLKLNPFVHVDWVGLACLLLCGFGWAKPVPIDARYYKDAKTGIIWTSFAGPIANFLLAFVCMFIYVALFKFAPVFLYTTTIGLFIASCLSTTALMSIGFGIFNLIPIPPLDGSKILFSFLPDEIYYRFIKGSTMINLLFIAVLFSGILSSPMMMLRNEIFNAFYYASAFIFGI